jgi:uncharacterized protein (DUF1330 family)
MTAYYTQIACTPSTYDWIADYAAQVPRLVAKHGGRYLYQTSDYERLEEAEPSAALVIVIEWPDKASAERFYGDPDYQGHKQARQGGSSTQMLLVPGC